MTMPLDGIRVVDLTRMAPGPFCTMVLGDMGANGAWGHPGQVYDADSVKRQAFPLERFRVRPTCGKTLS